MSALHDVLHKLVDLIPHPSEGHAAALHEAVDDLPEYLEHPGDDELGAEQGDDQGDGQE